MLSALLNNKKLKITNKINPSSEWVTLILCWLFAILFAVWLLPHTVAIRHGCLALGAVLGFWVIFKNYRLLFQIRAIPIFLLILLLAWVTFHLIFIGVDYENQFLEYTRIWKKIAIGIPFGLGLGISLRGSIGRPKERKYWQIICLGFLLPSIIYFIKLIATTVGHKFHIPVSNFLFLSPDHLSNLWGVSRAAYVFFCMPAFTITLGISQIWLSSGKLNWRESLLYGLSFILPLMIFVIENDRTGVLYCVFLIILLTLIFVKKNYVRFTKKSWVLLAFLILAVIAIVIVGLQRNDLWKTLIPDAKLAVQIDKYDYWKHLKGGSRELLINEAGIPIQESNYDRIAWAIRGATLLPRFPLGYGLMTLSFGALNRIDIPDSQTSLSHSAWLDFALGYGIPGLLLLLSASIFVWFSGVNTADPWKILIRWVLGYWILLFFTKELSMEIFMNAFIFCLVWFCALTLQDKSTELND